MAAMGTHVEDIALALGSNLGDRLAMLRAAVAALTPFVTVQKKSAIYETPPAYVTDQPAFLNAVLLGTTGLEPLALLRALKQTEIELGREPSFRNGPRLIDIDILFFGERNVETPELVVPHPRLAEREFALRPLADVAPDWRHPVTGLTVQTMLVALPEQTARRTEDAL